MAFFNALTSCMVVGTGANRVNGVKISSVLSVNSYSISLVYNDCVMSILHFRRQLDRPPVAHELRNICVRNIELPHDIAQWLALRARATTDQSPGARPWTEGDFRTEMQAKPWWRSDHSWLAITGEPASAGGDEGRDLQIVASVTLAMREGSTRTVP